MLKNTRTAARKIVGPVQLATLFSLAFFTAGIITYDSNPGLLAQHIIYTGIFFLCMWIACRLFSDGVARRLRLEGVDTDTAGDMVYTFVIYLEFIKHVVGVSFTLGWIAGTLLCWEYLGDRVILIPVAASLGVSLACFMVTSGLSRFVDQLRWPETEE
ncbi:MAG: hypothetical protein KAT93_00745 [Desulfuromonadales bacterium]|nr:hypothetical protein [Desulfuromonadales bacterium]